MLRPTCGHAGRPRSLGRILAITTGKLHIFAALHKRNCDSGRDGFALWCFGTTH
jgi:hypothetical protein